MSLKVGDRVRVKAEVVEDYIQPWRSRFESGRIGTVQSLPDWDRGLAFVAWDHKRSKRESDWRLQVRISDLEMAP